MNKIFRLFLLIAVVAAVTGTLFLSKHVYATLTNHHSVLMPANYNYSAAANIIAICLGTTTRKMAQPSLARLALFKSFFPSLEQTLEEGFVYRVYVGYDVGDAFYDQAGQDAAIQKWFDHEFSARRLQGIDVSLHLKRLENIEEKPGPVFNKLLAKAYADGTDFFYRVNDDSVFLTQWASSLRDFVIGFGPPYGVVGPWCGQGNGGILTHDFVHRTHMDIFEGVYYPPVFTDWYMDDWITRVYGRKRTRRLEAVKVEHRTSAHGRRYSVDIAHGNYLDAEIDRGRDKIAEWMSNENMSAWAISDFLNDTRTFTVREPTKWFFS